MGGGGLRGRRGLKVRIRVEGGARLQTNKGGVGM